MLLRDYAITPDVFDETSYPHPAACDAELRNLKDVLLEEGLVRDLRSGEWSRLVLSSSDRCWHRRGKELLKKLRQQSRLIPYAPVLTTAPVDDCEWCREALGTHDDDPLSGGIIVTKSVKDSFSGEARVARIDHLSNTPWWGTRAPSVALRRDMREYLGQLAPVLNSAKSLMFIDPHLDPSMRRYRDFGRLLQAVRARNPAPAIEIHRVCYEGSGPGRRFPMETDPTFFQKRFRDAMETQIREANLRVEVFIWDDFHDRYLISDLIGISLPYGFDTTTNPNSITRWTRLGRRDRDDVQREFDPASERHVLRDRFIIE